jgi:DNA invertase Pin-like site-specific DNA recombinase
MLNLMGSFAEFEREIMLERQREGVARAKAEGKYRGRVPTAQRKSAEVVQLRGQGVKPEEIAARLGISRASVFRVLKIDVAQRTDSRGKGPQRGSNLDQAVLAKERPSQ